uniref:Uncharacterized protein n=1 Tax=Staphylococcus aureus TaxID=1280 RepID=Q9LBZ8_STAAU|nr:hypothetical protein [Staphylococcus aureus]
MNAITILFVTTIFIGNLNITSSTGIIMNAPPAPTIPDTKPMIPPIVIKSTRLNLI